MKLYPRLEGGISIAPEHEDDWKVLARIPQDAGSSDEWVASLANLMDDASEWEAYVVPDLSAAYRDQCEYVTLAIQQARSQGASAVFITPDDVEKWYGAINQARLALEARYGMSDIEDATEALPVELSDAYGRDLFYQTLLSLLLDFVMNDKDEQK